MKNLREMSMEEFDEFAYNELNRIIEFDLLILKGHILIEYTLNCYLESISQKNNSDFFNENFTFANKIKILDHFGNLCNSDNNLINELVLLNKLRNSIAHSLVYNDLHLESFFREITKKNVPIERFKNKREKFIASIAFLTGAIQTGYKKNTKPEEINYYLFNNKKKTDV